MAINLLIGYVILISLAAGWFIWKYKRKKKKLDLTINRIRDAVISVDSSGRYTFLNDAALATHPLGRGKTLGKVIWDMHPQTVGTVFWDAYHKAAASGKMVEVEDYYPAMDKWFSVKIYPSDTGLTIFYIDITESKNIRIQLGKSEEKYRTLFYQSPLPSWLYDIETLQFIDVNEAAVKHYGYTHDEFLSMTIKDIRPEEDIPSLLRDIAQVKDASGISRYSSWRHLKKNGELIIVEATAHSFSHEEKPTRLVIVNDITQKKITEQKLLNNQAMLKEAQAIGRLGYWDVDLQTGTHSWSEELYKILGIDRQEASPSTARFLALLDPADQRQAEVIIDQALHDLTESKTDFRFYTYSGERRYGYIEWRFSYNADQVPVRLFGIVQDITERKEAEEGSKLLELKIKEHKIQAQKKISKAIIKAQEKHKNYIAQELHDNINQILFGAKLYLGLAGKKHPEISEFLDESVSQVTRAMGEIQSLCQNLVSPLSNADLKEIITEMVQKLNKGMNSQLNISLFYDITRELPNELKLNIYRIIQEQLHNVRKHADANNVDINVAEKEGSIMISVADDGKGFDVKQKRKGLGISNMMHRVEAFNGRISIQSEVGKGCRTDISIPIGAIAEESAEVLDNVM